MPTWNCFKFIRSPHDSLLQYFFLLYFAEDSHAIKMWFNMHTWLKIGLTLTAGKKKTCFAKHER